MRANVVSGERERIFEFNYVDVESEEGGSLVVSLCYGDGQRPPESIRLPDDADRIWIRDNEGRIVARYWVATSQEEIDANPPRRSDRVVLAKAPEERRATA